MLGYHWLSDGTLERESPVLGDAGLSSQDDVHVHSQISRANDTDGWESQARCSRRVRRVITRLRMLCNLKLFISGIFHLVFSDHSWLQVTETMESKIEDKGGPLPLFNLLFCMPVLFLIHVYVHTFFFLKKEKRKVTLEG